VNYISEQFLAGYTFCYIFRVVAGICHGVWTRLRSSSPSSLGFSALHLPPGEDVHQAVLQPWHRSAGAVGVCLPPCRSCGLHLVVAVTPSLVLPFRLIGSLISVAYNVTRTPLLWGLTLGTVQRLLSHFPAGTCSWLPWYTPRMPGWTTGSFSPPWWSSAFPGGFNRVPDLLSWSYSTPSQTGRFSQPWTHQLLQHQSWTACSSPALGLWTSAPLPSYLPVFHLELRASSWVFITTQMTPSCIVGGVPWCCRCCCLSTTCPATYCRGPLDLLWTLLYYWTCCSCCSPRCQPSLPSTATASGKIKRSLLMWFSSIFFVIYAYFRFWIIFND